MYADRISPNSRNNGTSTSPESPSETHGARTPFITVAIPTFHRVELLTRAVESVLAQTYADWELVVSDEEEGEGEAWLYLQSISRHDPRIRPVKNKIGRASCRERLYKPL